MSMKLHKRSGKQAEITQEEWEASAKVVRKEAWPKIQEELLGSILMDKIKNYATKISD